MRMSPGLALVMAAFVVAGCSTSSPEPSAIAANASELPVASLTCPEIKSELARLEGRGIEARVMAVSLGREKATAADTAMFKRQAALTAEMLKKGC